MKITKAIWNTMTEDRFKAGYGMGYNEGVRKTRISARSHTLEDVLLQLETEHVRVFEEKTLAKAIKGAKREDLLRLGYDHAIAMVKQMQVKNG